MALLALCRRRGPGWAYLNHALVREAYQPACVSLAEDTWAALLPAQRRLENGRAIPSTGEPSKTFTAGTTRYGDRSGRAALAGCRA